MLRDTAQYVILVPERIKGVSNGVDSLLPLKTFLEERMEPKLFIWTQYRIPGILRERNASRLHDSNVD